MSRTGIEPKPPWRTIPRRVRDAVSTMAQSHVTRAMRVWGGFGPSPTFRLRFADGRRAFLKCCSPMSNPTMRAHYYRELQVYADTCLHIHHWSPVVYGHVTVDDWHLLLLEDLGPRSVPPWSPHVAKRIMRCLGEFHTACRNDRPRWLQHPDTWFDQAYLWSWTANRAEIEQTVRFTGRYMPQAIDWFASVGPRLAAVARGFLERSSAQQLIHGDLRSDNLRWTERRLYLFDWSLAVAGPPEFDVAMFAQSIAAESALLPRDLIGWYEESRSLDPSLLDAALCGATSFFASQAWQEEIPGLPRLRAFQRRQFLVSLLWALDRLAIAIPPWLRFQCEAEGIPSFASR